MSKLNSRIGQIIAYGICTNKKNDKVVLIISKFELLPLSLNEFQKATGQRWECSLPIE